MDKQRVDFPVHRTALPRGSRKCKSCGRLIYFYRHPVTGKAMPLDVATKVLSEGGSYYRLESHFAYCTAADQFRKRDPAAPAPAKKRTRAKTQAEQERLELFGRPEDQAEDPS